jgi:hypothetical protein
MTSEMASSWRTKGTGTACAAQTREKSNRPGTQPIGLQGGDPIRLGGGKMTAAPHDNVVCCLLSDGYTILAVFHLVAQLTVSVEH